MPHETDLTEFHIIEGTTPKIEYELFDENDNKIVAPLSTQVASIYDATSKIATPTWIDTDIDGLEGNSVTLGEGSWTLPSDATAKLNTTDEYEDKIISIDYTYGVAERGIHHIKIRIFREPILT